MKKEIENSKSRIKNIVDRLKKFIKKITDWFKYQWGKSNICLVIFVFIVYSVPLYSNYNKANWLLDFALISASVIICRNVFDDHYKSKWVYYFWAILLVIVCLCGYSYIIYVSDLSKNILSDALNFSIRMLTLFMLFYPLYEKYIKNKIIKKYDKSTKIKRRRIESKKRKLKASRIRRMSKVY